MRVRGYCLGKHGRKEGKNEAKNIFVLFGEWFS